MNHRTLFVTVISLLAIGAALYWSFTSVSVTEPLSPEENRTRFTSPHFVGYHEGERQWSLEAALIEEAGADRPGILLLEEITRGVLYRDGEEYLTFRGDRGEWKPEGSELTLEGNVQFYEKGELLLTSEKVIWHGSEELLVSPVRVLAYYDKQTVEADHLEVESAEERVHMSGNVIWTNDDGVRVRATSAVYTKDQLSFSGLLEPVRFEWDQGGVNRDQD